MKAYEIMNYLEQYFPLALQMDFDKCGLQIGNGEKEIQKVFVALNADNDSLNQCIAQHCQMMITHHPFLLETIHSIDLQQHQGYFIKKAIEHDIVVYSLHTCLDRGQNGISMNDWLLSMLPVKHIECYDEIEVGKKGILKEPMKGEDWIQCVKETFHLEHLKYTRNTHRMIHRVALCGGSGADDIELLADQVDCYITGDCKYRHGKYAIDHDCLLIDVGHHLEVIIEEKLPELLKNLPIEIDICHSQDYFDYE